MAEPSDQSRAPDPVAPLVDAARNGDRDALEQLLKSSYERIYTVCRRICHSREQAEDATQNALVAIVRGLEGFDGRSSFSTWSHRIATNSSLDELRRSTRHHSTSLDSDPLIEDSEAVLYSSRPGPDVNPGNDPSDRVIRSETREVLSRALDSLDDRFRVPLVLCDVADYDYDEISRVLNLAPGTVRSRIHRARRQLAQVLSGTDLDPRRDSREETPPVDGATHRDGVAGTIGNQSDGLNVKTDEP